MVKVFLSHSAQQEELATKVAENIGRDVVFLYEYSFDPAVSLTNEIKQKISDSNIFVLFLSKAALDSPWVKMEIETIIPRLFVKDILFVPFIVDEDIKPADVISQYDWMREYNLVLFTNAQRIAMVIKSHIAKVSGGKLFSGQMRSMRFVGRAKELNQLTNDSVSSPSCRAMIVSGFPQSGRRRLLLEFISRVLQSHIHYEDAVRINLHSNESLDELVFQLKEYTYVTSYKDLYQTIGTNVAETEKLCVQLLTELAKQGDYIFVNDDKSIVMPDGTISSWFDRLLKSPNLPNKINFYIVSQYYLNPGTQLRHKNVAVTKISDFTTDEKLLLFKLYAEEKDVSYQDDDAIFFAKQPSGFPGYILDVVEEIGKTSVNSAKRYLNGYLRQYDNNIESVVQEIANDKDTLQLLLIIARLEYATYDILQEIMDDINVEQILENLTRYSVIEFFGTGGIYVRLNMYLEDYLLRSEREISKRYMAAIEKKTKDLVLHIDDESLNLCEHFYAIKKNITDNISQIKSQRYLRPTMALKIVVEQYRKGNYPDVVTIAKYVLYESANSVYKDVRYPMYYWLCLTYCRMNNVDDLTIEIENFKNEGASTYVYNFILGYSERLRFHYNEALSYYLQALPKDTEQYMSYLTKVKHELVMVYMKKDMYPKALKLARQNYLINKNNIYNVEPYYRCLVCSKNPDMAILAELRQKMEESQSVDSPIIVKTFDIEKEYYQVNGNSDKAIDALERLLSQYKHLKKGYTLDALKRICSTSGKGLRYQTIKKQFVKKHDDEEELWID